VNRPIARFVSSRRFLGFALFAAGGTLLSAFIALRWSRAWEVTASEWAPWLDRTLASPPLTLPWLGPAFLRSLSPAWIATVLFSLACAALLVLAFLPAVEIHESYLKNGRRKIDWRRITRVDQTAWRIPLAVFLTLDDERRVLLIHAGDAASCATLLRYLRRYSREALLDGIPYREFWGEPPAPDRKQLSAARYPLLLPEEEEEIERMFQRLKTVGHLDQRGSDEK
jgi:hypothetical protein